MRLPNATTDALSSHFRDPAEALTFLLERRERLRERESGLLNYVQAVGATPAALSTMQAQLDTIEYLRSALTDDAGEPLEVFPPACRPRGEAEARERGHRLHKTLASVGITDHAGFASDVLGREVEHFRLLSEEETGRVRSAALERAPESPEADAGGHGDEREEVRALREECEEAGVLRPITYASRVVGRKLTRLGGATGREIGDVRRQLRHDKAKGVFGGRRPGESTLAHHGRTKPKSAAA